MVERYLAHYFKIHFAKPDFPTPFSGEIDTNSSIKLFKHQEEIVRVLVRCHHEKRNFAVFAETGTGKTRSIVDFIRTMRMVLSEELRVLVACPYSLIGVWRDQIDHFGKFETKVIHGPGRVITDEPGFYLTSYGTLSNDWKQHSPYDIAIFDESHLLKNPQSVRAKAACKVKAVIKIVMTGTPYGNEYKDLWSQMNVVDPQIFGPRNVFEDAFCEFGGYENKEIVGYRNTDLMFEILKRNSIIIRKKDCLDLPPKLYTVLKVPMNDKQTAAYNRCLEGGVEDMPISAILQQIAKLRQISSGFVYYGDEVIGYGTAKTAYLRDLQYESPTIIWYNFNEELRQITENLPCDFVVADGSHKASEAVNLFESGKANVIIAQMKTLQYGFTLNRTSRVIYFSGCFSGLDRQQSEDRCHRIGQTKSVNYIDLIGSPIEEWMKAAVDQKKNVQDYVLERLLGKV